MKKYAHAERSDCECNKLRFRKIPMTCDKNLFMDHLVKCVYNDVYACGSKRFLDLDMGIHGCCSISKKFNTVHKTTKSSSIPYPQVRVSLYIH